LRGFFIKKNNLIFGNIGFFFKKNYRFEYCFFSFLRKLLKFLLVIKYSFFSYKQYWLFLGRSFKLFKKSKNSRMGSGRGLFFRYISSLSCFKIFLELLLKQNYMIKFFFIKKFIFNNNVFFIKT